VEVLQGLDYPKNKIKIKSILFYFILIRKQTLLSGEINMLDAGIRGVHLKHSGSITICFDELFFLI
jgi:hypothetical protein